MSELIMELPECPICGKPTVRGVGDSCHCGSARLLRSELNHYLSFKTEPPNGWPKKGCPICGRPMKEVGKWHSITVALLRPAEDKGEGLERMLCDQLDHYCYVTKAWYEKNRR